MVISNKKLYRVKSRETLWEIAEKELGDATKWREITKKDGSSFTRYEAKRLEIGREIYIPMKTTKNFSNKDSIPSDKDNNKDEINESELDITHRELLTFSNLANLEWQFVNLNPKDKNGKKIYPKLNNLLSDPELFAKTDDEGEIDEYTYGKLEDGTYDKERGLAEMRKEAGIAMEYLEKEEGNFLQQWEVIYAADNYKLATDYIDDMIKDRKKRFGEEERRTTKDYRKRSYRAKRVHRASI